MSGDNRIHIKNTTSDDLYVLLSPNTDWVAADLGFQLALPVVVGGVKVLAGIKTIDKARKVSKAVKTAQELNQSIGQKVIMAIKNNADLFRALLMVKKLHGMLNKMKTSTNLQQLAAADEIDSTYAQMQRMITSGCIKIKPGETKLVNVKEILNALKNVIYFLKDKTVVDRNLEEKDFENRQEWDKYLNDKRELERKASQMSMPDFVSTVFGALTIINPSTFLSVFSGVKDMKILLVDQHMERMALFASNSDQSWIVREHDVLPSVYGNTDEVNEKGGYKPFVKIKGHSLMPGEYLNPNEAIAVNISAATVPNPYLAERPAPSPEPEKKSLWGKILGVLQGIQKTKKVHDAPKFETMRVTGGATVDMFFSQDKLLLYKPDGNLVLYDNSGNSPKELWSTNTANRGAWRVYMQDDGNLCVYSDEAKCEWATWKVMPDKKFAGGYVGLDPTTGKLGFFDGNTDKMLYEVDKKNDTFRA